MTSEVTPDTIFEPLQLISDHIYLYETQVANDIVSSSPSLIILCTWVGGATPRRINKYVSQYRKIYPYTSILLITTDFATTALRPFSWIRANLSPARLVIRRIIERIGKDTQNVTDQGGILLHLFSHGGGNTALQLALSLKEEHDQGIWFFSKLKGIILDCCPGDDGLQRAYAAARTSVPETPIFQFLGTTLLYPAMAVMNTLQHARLIRAIQDLREQLNDPSSFGSKARRLYMYSRQDIMVKWEDVESHIQDARFRGYKVEKACFEHGSHCGLIMEDATRYWTTVQRFWKDQDVSDVATEGNIRSRL
ncbi:hypothetical protein N7540_002646 [Penicillium herquei]|nr:hypothetical protein N7540_002646 [Penicillium herquei]